MSPALQEAPDGTSTVERVRERKERVERGEEAGGDVEGHLDRKGDRYLVSERTALFRSRGLEAPMRGGEAESGSQILVQCAYSNDLNLSQQYSYVLCLPT